MDESVPDNHDTELTKILLLQRRNSNDQDGRLAVLLARMLQSFEVCTYQDLKHQALEVETW